MSKSGLMIVKEVEKGFNTNRWRLIHTIDRGDRGETLLILVDKMAALKLMKNQRPLRFCLAAFTIDSIVIVPKLVRKMIEGTVGDKTVQEQQPINVLTDRRIIIIIFGRRNYTT